jgi:VWFA-related protein
MSNCSLKRFFLTVAVVLLVLAPATFGQDKQNSNPREQPEDVVRVNTDLVQTDVMVFDKQGRFVNGLKREDFELRIDGRSQSISFFDHVTAGSADEESQLAAARGAPLAKTTNVASPVPLDRGRTIFFYVDDLHLAPNNLVSARNVVLHYLENEMGQNDEAAVTSASGQIGFLQQLNDNKAVLRAAVERIKARSYLVRDFERPQMTEYQALAIERNNRDVIDYFVDELMKDLPTLPTIAAPGGLPRGRAEQQVRARASVMLQQAAAVATNTLIGLESLVRSLSKLPGRKLVFFVSDGFFLDDRNSDTRERLRHITSLAARNGTVIYSMDARGLVASMTDAGSDVAADPSGRLQRISAGELVESQDVMNALANDTGGRTIFNTNALDAGLAKVLKETSAYYLLAWRPERAEQKSDKSRRIEISVTGRPELTVRFRRGFFDAGLPPDARQAKSTDERGADANPGKVAEAKLRAAITATFPERDLPVSLSLTWIDTPEKRQTLTISLQVNGEAVSFNAEDGKQRAVVDIAGSVYDDEGKVGATFGDRLTITGSTEAKGNGGHNLAYSYQVTVHPGLYQVRVGARDEKTGRIGSAQDWIEIPDISKNKVVLSSLLVSERKPPSLTASASSAAPGIGGPLPDQVSVSVDHRFQRNAFLRFLVFIYTALQSGVRPDVAVQVQILRDDQPVLATSLRKVSSEGTPDLTRLPYAADISLEQLPAGHYLLQVTAIDRVSRTTALQRMRFEIE